MTNAKTRMTALVTAAIPALVALMTLASVAGFRVRRAGERVKSAFPIAAALIAASLFLVTASDASAQGPTPSSTPQVTSDLVLIVNNSYQPGDSATISIRNDGTVPYYYYHFDPACSTLSFRDSMGRTIKIAVAAGCHVLSRLELAPGETAILVQGWNLDECPAFSEVIFGCFAILPLATDQYTISGTFDSVDSTKRAEVSKTVSIQGPAITSDIELTQFVVVSDPPTAAGPYPINIDLRNIGQKDYTYPTEAGCYTQVVNPEGNFVFPPPLAPCTDRQSTDTLSPGESITLWRNWQGDECIEFGATSCITSKPLAPGDYVIRGGLFSTDKQSYARFSIDFGVNQFAQITPTPATTPGGFPKSGGAPGTNDSSSAGAATALAVGAVLAGLGSFALVRATWAASRHER